VPLELLDYRTRALPSTTQIVGGIGGVQVVTFDQVPGQQIWRIDGITVIAFVPLAPVAVRLFDVALSPNAVPVEVTQLAPYWALGSGGEPSFWWDVCDRSSPITITSGGQLSIVFDGVGAQPAGVCLARIQYAVLQGLTGAPVPAAGSIPAGGIPVGI